MTLLVALMMVLSLAGCHAEEKMDEAVNGAMDKVQSAADTEYSSYEDVYGDYSAQLAKKGKTLAKELKKEAPARYEAEGTLGKLYAEKSTELMKLYQKGANALSEYMLFSGDDQESYNEWNTMLRADFEDAKDVLMDAYMEALSEVQ